MLQILHKDISQSEIYKAKITWAFPFLPYLYFGSLSSGVS